MIDLSFLSGQILDKEINNIYIKEYILLKEKNGNEYYRAMYIVTIDVGKCYNTQLSFKSTGSDFLCYENDSRPIIAYLNDYDYTYESSHPYYATEISSLFESEGISYLSGMLITSIDLISDRYKNVHGYSIEIAYSERINFLIEEHSKKSGAHLSENCFKVSLQKPQHLFYVDSSQV